VEAVDRPVHVYGLMGPDQVIRYVGRTTRPVDERLRDHRGMCKPDRIAPRHRRGLPPLPVTPLVAWMIRTGPQLVTAELLETCTPTRAVDQETYWIYAHRTWLAEGGYNRRPPC
jgi:hypothetical protein